MDTAKRQIVPVKYKKRVNKIETSGASKNSDAKDARGGGGWCPFC